MVRNSAANNLTVSVDRGGPIQLQFFGNLDLGQVAAAELTEGSRLEVASLVDLAGMKAAVVTQRAEVKDYLDIYALLTTAEISLSTMLAAAAIIYGAESTLWFRSRPFPIMTTRALPNFPRMFDAHLSRPCSTRIYPNCPR